MYTIYYAILWIVADNKLTVIILNMIESNFFNKIYIPYMRTMNKWVDNFAKLIKMLQGRPKTGYYIIYSIENKF